jgi:Sulfotransferase family
LVIDRDRIDPREKGRLPGLFVIGAMKSGTNYLRKLLGRHPSIFMTEVDEPSYFVDPDELKVIWPEMWARGYWHDQRNYFQLFASAGDATILGEASTNYTKIPLVTGVAERLHAFNPDARLIYLLRDPVERTISHYWHTVRYHSEYRSIAAAIRQDPQYVAISHYAMQLAPFRERFGDDRIAVLTYEELVRDPYATMGSLYRWLGLDPARVDLVGFNDPENVTPEVFRMPVWNGIPRKLWQSSPVRQISKHLPQRLQTRLREATNRTVRRQAVDVTEVIDFLQSVQRQQVDQLSTILNRGFPEWTTLHGHPDMAPGARVPPQSPEER